MPDRVHYLLDDPDSGRWGLRLGAGGTARIAPGSPYPAPGHPGSHLFRWERGRVLNEWQVVLITAGGGEYEDRSGRRMITAGQGFLLVPGRWHRYRPDPATGWHERWLAFTGPAAQRLDCDGRLDPAAPAWLRGTPGAVRSRLDEILVLLEGRPSGWRSEAEALLAALLARIDDAGEAPSGLRAAARRIEDDPAVAVSVLARAAGLSPSRFRQRFQAELGSSPRRYRQTVLASRAQRLLAIPDATVADIAEALGFADHAHFTRAFRRACGETPSAWRARQAGAVESHKIIFDR